MTQSQHLASRHGVIALLLICFLLTPPALWAAEPPVPVYIQADRMERYPARNLLRFQGAVDIKYGESHITADTVELNTASGDGIAEGHVHMEDPKRKFDAVRAEFNLSTHLGTLYQASGSLVGKAATHRRGEAPQPITFYLTAPRVVREAEDRYHVSRGTVTTCVGPSPAWHFKARDAQIEMEGYAHLRDATFWIRNVPVFYTPYLLVPTGTERATGFLPPAFGSSSTLGFFLNNQFYWAINDQSDATIGVDYLSRRGVSPNLEYRYVLSGVDYGQFNGLFLDDKVTSRQFWKVNGTSQQRLPGDVQGILALDLTSRDNYDRLIETQNILARTRREATSLLSLTRAWENVGVGLEGQQIVDVENRADEQLVRYPDVSMHYLPTLLPWETVALNADVSATNFRFDRIDSLGGNINRRRLNLQPQLAWTYADFPWLRVTPFLGLDETVFDQSGGMSETQSVPRLGAEVRGPQLFKIYGADQTSRYKHILEPSLTYTWIPHFTEKTRAQPLDILDDVFPRNDVALNLTNRILGHTPTGGVREIAFLRIGQGIDLSGQKGAEFTRIAPGPFFADLTFETRVQLTSTLSLQGNAAYDYDQGRLDIANARFTLQPLSFLNLSIDRRFRRDPDIDFINGSMGLTLPAGWSLTYSSGFNVRDNAFAGNAVTATYRPQCWNLSLGFLQLRGETRFTVQLGLDAFAGPRIGF